MIIFRYLTREILTTLAAVTLVMMLIMISSWIIRLLGPVAAGNEALDLAFWMLIYRLPYFLEMILPLALLIAILLAYGRMHGENEMTIFIATGTSENRLLAYTLIIAGFIMIAVAFCTLYLSPWGAQQREKIYELDHKTSEFDLLIPGRFQTYGKQVIYTEDLSKDKQVLQGLFIADEASFTLATEGERSVNPKTGSTFLELKNGRQYKFGEQGLALESLEFESYSKRLPKPTEYRRDMRNEAISTLDLLKVDDAKHKSQLYWRISLIIMVPITALLAFPLSRVKPRQGRYAKLLPAFLLFMVYVSSLISMINMMVKEQLSSPLLIVGLHAFYLSLSLLLIYWTSIKGLFKKAKT